MLKKSEIRKKEIQEAARIIFLEKGFAKATMEDIIDKTSLSKGGFYYYYKNTTDILYDMMVEGQKYRYEKMKKALEENKKNIDSSLSSELILEKILDDNYLMPIYVIFLQETKRNKKIKDLYEKIKEDSIKEILNLFNYNKKINKDFLTNFINAMILSCEILDTRQNFIENKKIIKSMIELILNE